MNILTQKHLNQLKRMKNNIRGLISGLLIFLSTPAFCQQPSAPVPVLEVIESMYKNYDSLAFLSFDVSFKYESDSVAGVQSNDYLTGSYTMAGKKTLYNLGDIHIMQNDSFFIAVYNADKLMLIDEPKTINSGNQLPMREQLDSLIGNFADQYTFSLTSISTDTGKITLLRVDSVAQFNKFTITYDKRDKLLYELYYEYPDIVEVDSGDNNISMIPVTKKLTVSFSKYRLDNYNDAAYDEGNYIYFENGVCKPVDKYLDFKVYYSRPSKTYSAPYIIP